MDENRRTWNALEDAHVNKTNTDLFKQFVLLIKINIETYKNNIEFFCIKIIIKLKKKKGHFEHLCMFTLASHYQ